MSVGKQLTSNRPVVMTGGTGFIGAAIVSELLARGRRVIALLRPGSDTWRLANHTENEALSRLTLNDQVLERVKSASPEVFINCAWQGVGGTHRNESLQITENLPTTIAMVELAAAAGCSHWIGFGSQAEYGNQNRRLSEYAPLSPTTLYGKAKLAAGISSLGLCEARDMTGTWLRVFSTYGPYDSKNWFIPYIVQEFLAERRPKLTACGQLWDYLYVEDAAKAVVDVMDAKLGGVFNLGSGTSRPLRDYVEAIRSALHSPLEPLYGEVPYRPDQVMHLEADMTKLFSAIRWRPAIAIEDGIETTIRFERKRAKKLMSIAAR